MVLVWDPIADLNLQVFQTAFGRYVLLHHIFGSFEASKLGSVKKDEVASTNASSLALVANNDQIQMHPLRTAENTHLWAKLMPLALLDPSLRRNTHRRSRALVLKPHFGGRSRKVRIESYDGPPRQWKLGAGPEGFYRRKEELRGNKCKNRGPRRRRRAL